MKHMQLLLKERHDKPQKKTLCSHCGHDTLRPPRKEAKKYDTPKNAPVQAMEEIKNDDSEVPTTSKAQFHLAQRILWNEKNIIEIDMPPS